ncbi:hypothetical protein ES332_A10G172600v1 [Gossypium tomentosum]|uniref:stearoyl-[acyl-carrier-protein] 9-desaturase n=1 Tax=Gossypium tomentosum TaxID=34277 RepID=A0A5D2NUA3_GOSTO|nr:hypothetical protein ES332_A10G172600v1 [Gossypium tomentosum]
MALKFVSMSFQSQEVPCSGGLPAMASFGSPRFFMTSTVPSANMKVENLRKTFMPHLKVQDQITHSMQPQKIEIFKSLDNWVENNILIHLKPVEKSWEPQDFLPDPTSDGFNEQVAELRERAKEIPDDYFVVLVGDMITEEALPTYQTMLNTLDCVQNRHGDLLNKYLYLSGRVDMRQIEKTIQYLIGSGMDPKAENNPYLTFIYTSFQERATFISHKNTAKIAKEHENIELARLCGFIAADEKRHETAYTKIVEKLFEIDPDQTVRAFADMMRKNINMPAQFILGVYTTKDYTDILEFLVDQWKVKELTGLSAGGRKAQEFVCQLPQRLRKLEVRAQLRAKEAPNVKFSWIYDRKLKL